MSLNSLTKFWMYLQEGFYHFMGCSCLDWAKLSMYCSTLAGSFRGEISFSLDQATFLNFQIWTITTFVNSENFYAVTLPLSTSAGATMNFTKSALELTMIASIRKPQLEPNHACSCKITFLKKLQACFFMHTM